MIKKFIKICLILSYISFIRFFTSFFLNFIKRNNYRNSKKDIKDNGTLVYRYCVNRFAISARHGRRNVQTNYRYSRENDYASTFHRVRHVKQRSRRPFTSCRHCHRLHRHGKNDRNIRVRLRLKKELIND